MENIENLIHGMQLNGFNDELIEKMLKLKAAAAELGWEMDGYDGMDGNAYITFMTSIRYTAGPKFEDAKEIGLYTDITKVIEEAGEKGLTQNELNSILGKDDSSDLNIMLKDLKTVGVLVESNDRPSK